MEILFLVVISLAALLAFLRVIAKDASRRSHSGREEFARQQEQARRQAQIANSRTAAHNRLNRLYQQLQLALLTLEQVPDFQRAASWAQCAQDIPLALRQRLFQRFRPRMVARFASCLAAGADARKLLPSLTNLVESLGVASFEAQYIQAEVMERQRRSDGEPSFEEQLRDLRLAHGTRLSALRRLEGVDPETKEQLLETEQTRFREAVLSLGDSQQSE